MNHHTNGPSKAQSKDLQGMIQRGLRQGLITTWELSKVIVPISAIITLLNHTPVIEWVTALCTPLMGWIGLPGEATIVLVLGFVLNLYAAIGAMLALSLATPELLILSVMLSFCHNLFVEGAVAKRLGLSAAIVIGIRLVTALVSGYLLHLVLGNEVRTLTSDYVHTTSYLWDAPGAALTDVLDTLVTGIWQLALIVVPLMLVIQILKEYDVLNKLARPMAPLLKLLGLTDRAAIPMLAGLVFGLAYGAGVILEANRERPMNKRELYLLMLFLILCHAVVEDTLIFLPLGINIWLLLGIRLVAALLLTIVVARLWRRRLQLVRPNQAA